MIDTRQSSRRVCMSKTPSDLDATGFTHLVFAFAYFHPTTFQITPMDAADIPLYSEFTGLKSRKASLRTWIAIGGWSFNDPVNVPDTQRAFSDMSSSSESCAAFIRSCLQFMQTYGFDGVDLGKLRLKRGNQAQPIIYTNTFTRLGVSRCLGSGRNQCRYPKSRVPIARDASSLRQLIRY